MKRTETAGSARSSGLFWLRLALDVLLAAFILVVFYFFLRIFPQFRKNETAQEAQNTESGMPLVTEEEDQTADILFGEEGDNPGAEHEQAAVIVSADDNDSGRETEAQEALRLPFRRTFASFFTEELVFDDNSCTSPEFSVQITEVTDSEHGSVPFKAYIADIRVASVENLRAGFPSGKRTDEAKMIALENDAILAVNGDFYVNISKGLVVRNGTVLRDEEGTADICVLYPDGKMKTYGPGEYTAERILNQNPWQVWSFGPELLEEDGSPKTDFNTSSVIYNRNPRTAFGYYEPGHYCMVVIDGRNEGDSGGASIRALARFMADLGCKAAYNLDGGASSVMVFDGRTVNIPSGGGRKLSDMVMICELQNTVIIPAGG